MRAEAVEQVFVRREGAATELLLVLESPAGERFRERLRFPTPAAGEALEMAARHLAGRGLVASDRLRLRVERGGTLEDDDDLRRRFAYAMLRERSEEGS